MSAAFGASFTITAIALLGITRAAAQEPLVFDHEFSQQDHGWVAGFSDYGLLQGPGMNLESGHRPRPDDPGRKALHIAGSNHSDDLFMFHKKRVTLAPDQWYRVDMSVSFLSSVAPGLVGIGGAPAESVRVKAGAMVVEPLSRPRRDDHFRMNIDKGNQASEGRDTDNLGHIANSGTPEFELVERTNAGLPPFWVRTDAAGSVWLLVGTDSGFEGRTELYYTRMRFVFTPLALRIAKADAGISLTWDLGVLEESGDLETWSTVPDAVSPWQVTPSTSRKFWRLTADPP